MVNCSAQATQLQQSQSIGEVEAQGQIRIVQQARVTGAYFVYPIWADGLIDAAVFTAQAAIEADVQLLVDKSQRPARREAKSHVSCDHWVSERVFNWSGIPTTHLGPRGCRRPSPIRHLFLLAVGSDILHIFRPSRQTRSATLPVTLARFEQSYWQISRIESAIFLSRV